MNLYFAPDQDCLTPLLAVINSAKKFLLVADYSFSAPAVTDALVAAHLRGVSVRLVLDKSQSSGKAEKPEVTKLQAAGVDFVIGTSDKHRIMHLKVAVADDTVAFGSYNFTNAAALENNVLAVVTDPAVALQFSAQIQKAYDWIKSSQLSLGHFALIERTPMDFKALAKRAAVVFLAAFVAVLGASGFGLSHLPSMGDAEKVGLAAIVAGVDAVFVQVVLPLLQFSAVKLGLRK